ncbi:sugar ABC transporter permease [Enterococcus faecalis]|nr:sugar ABC transporter permease [Enterococcus faecalis]TQB30337.1 sugar ABC transporter permease [Enterococcus faecalis]
MKRKYGYFLIAPFFIVFLVFGLYPIIYTFYLSFFQWDGISDLSFQGVMNYKVMLEDPIFWLSIRNTLKIWIVNFIPQIGFALLLAGIFTFNKIRGMSFFRAIFYLPNLLTAASVGLLFNLLFQGDNSVINTLLLNIGIIGEPIRFFSSPVFTSLITSYVQWWMWFGYTLIIIMAGMSSIDESIYEAAMIDGANKLRIFRSITIPQIRPTIIYLMLTSIIGGMQLFDVPATITDGMGAPDKSILTISMYIYNHGFKSYNMGYAATLSIGLFVVIAILSIIYLLVQRKGAKK